MAQWFSRAEAQISPAGKGIFIEGSTMPLLAIVRRYPRRLLAVAIFALLLVSVLLFKPAAPPKSAPLATHATLSVTVTRPRLQQWPVTLSANGNITAWQEAIVGAEIGGLRLTELLVDVGDKVKKGQLLATLQQESVAADLAQSRANLAEASAAQAEATANADRARRVQGKGTMSEQQTANYLTAELTAKARVDALRARVHSDEIRLAQTRVLAPDDGTITARAATLGAVVQTGDILFHLIRKDRLEWRAELPAAELARIEPGMTVQLQSSGDHRLDGSVRRVAPTLDAQSRNGIVYVDLQPGSEARAGMYARGEITLGKQTMLTLPQSALLLRDGFHYLFQLDKDGQLRQIKVTPGMRRGSEIAILDGLTEGMADGTPIIDSGVGFLNDGDRVKVVDPAMTASTTAQDKE